MKLIIRTLMVASAVSFVGGALAADLNDCGAKQVKALGKLLDAQFKEAARACGTADGDSIAAVEGEVNDDKITAAVEKFNDAVVDTVADFGASNCFLDDPGSLADPIAVVAQTEDAASDLCDSNGSN